MRDIPEHKQFLEDFMSDKYNAEWAKERRLAYLSDRLEELILAYAPMPTDIEWIQELQYEQMVKIKKEIDVIVNEMEAWRRPKYKDQKITEEMIESAREYPISNLVEVNKQNFAQCVWHNDNNPSMYCKNNYAYCFSCGAKGSVIDVYIALYGCNFKEAVKFLSRY